MKYGLLGEKLGHSFSKEIHARLADYEYELRELNAEELDALFRKKDFEAVNVTIPYKQTVIPYLDEISERAKTIGAVNAVVNRDGKLFGDNTDFAGMRALAIHAGADMKNKKVLVLGTGGTSKTARAVAKDLGAREVLRVSRTKKEDAVTYEEAAEKHSDAQIIINTTPVGMFPKTNASPIALSAFPKLEAVLDAIFNPLRTELVLSAQEKGITASGGLYMLVAQAVYASALFLNKETDEKKTDEVYKEILNEKRNIFLIGMPSSGKSSVGKKFAEMTGKEFEDTDTTLVKKFGEPIADYIRKNGEKAFRDAESEVIAEAAKERGKVIATGGGAILREENVREMKRNGVTVFLDRDLSLLTATSDRPLSSTKEALERLYNERFPIYEKAADVTVKSNDEIGAVAQAVRKELDI